jgi:hypothetical protein
LNKSSLEARLTALTLARQTTTYGALARDIGLTGPSTIARLTDALEALMQDDTAAGRPLRAALVNARGKDLPAPGFFAKAKALGHDIADPQGFIDRTRKALFDDA